MTFHEVKRLFQSIAGGYSCSMEAQALMHRFPGGNRSAVRG